MLYIVATPIGNLEDISLRALDTLKKVDLILCEDTRVTRKLLSRYEVTTPTMSYHQHSKLTKIEKIIELLKSGQELALVSDAGTPGISDPGTKLISESLKAIPDLHVVPIPGASAVTAIASVSGFPVDRFTFLGFPPVKKKRQKFFQQALGYDHPVILYESVHRIVKTLTDLQDLASDQKLQVIVGRELTKMFETIYRGTISEVLKELEADKVKGEFTIVINKQ